MDQRNVESHPPALGGAPPDHDGVNINLQVPGGGTSNISNTTTAAASVEAIAQQILDLLPTLEPDEDGGFSLEQILSLVEGQEEAKSTATGRGSKQV
ncbi:hypothetical protein Ndes2526B_g07869 [Nannochloris sp. 'desiccata']|nr:hypothetical protein KSW81_002526 [Chlorella desiccata (nom. nud.)]